MTEITDNSAEYFAPRAPEIQSNILIKAGRRPGYIVDPVAFFIALIGGPMMVTALTFWLFLIPVGALIIGGPIYLVIGTPLLLIYLRRNPATKRGIAWLAFCAVLALAPLSVLFALITGEDPRFTVFVIAFGLVFAPLWGSAFSWIYQGMRRDFYTVARY